MSCNPAAAAECEDTSRLHFAYHSFRFVFQANETVCFPPAAAANVLRGAFGLSLRQLTCPPSCTAAAHCTRAPQCAYARLFEPHAAALSKSPSGLADWPRPFVFRAAAALDGRTVTPGSKFHFDLHVFDVRSPVLPDLALAFRQLGRAGIGPGRGRVDLLAAYALTATGELGAQVYDGVAQQLGPVPPPISIALTPPAATPAVERLKVLFVTPTELKEHSAVAQVPTFAVLFGRLRDRLSALSTLYQHNPLPVDFRGLGEKAAQVQLLRHSLQWEYAARKSTRTGQRHPLGGFTGWAEYAGDLREFLPYLEAGCIIGVGRQTVWGKGEVRLAPVGSA